MKKPVLMLMVAGMFAFASCESNNETRVESETEEVGEGIEREGEEIEGEVEEGAGEVEREIEN